MLDYKISKIFRVFVPIISLLIYAPITSANESIHDDLGIDNSISYDAIRHVETPNAKMSFKEYRAPQKTLLEMNMQGMLINVLVREDQRRAYSIMPSLGMYQEITPEEAGNQSGSDTKFLHPKFVENEVVYGHMSKKYSTEFTDSSGSGSGFVWVTNDGVPIKFDMTYSSKGMKNQRVFMFLKDLAIRPQAPHLFELAADLRSMVGASGIFSQLGVRNDADSPSLIKEVGNVVKEETKRTARQEARDKVRRGLRNLFGR